MDEIKKTILNKILKLDENIGLDKRLITNDINFLEQILKNRKTRKKVILTGIAILLTFIVTLPLFNYYGSLKIMETYSTLVSCIFLLIIIGYKLIVNYNKINDNIETKIFLLSLAQSLNELK